MIADYERLREKSTPPRARKSLGQHFLTAQGVSRRIAALLNSQPGDSILEIGPGPGALTRQLAELAPAELLLLEKDAYWALEQKKALPASTVVNMDALEFEWQRLQGKWRIAGNLPYNVASPLLWEIVSRCNALCSGVFMIQKEVAQRICAKPHSRQYGALSVWIQSFAHPQYSFAVSPGCFNPPPKVDSAVIVLSPRKHADFAPAALKSLLNVCFQNRRKQLGGILQKRGHADLLNGMESLGLDRMARPEDITPEQFQAWSAWL